MSNRLRDKMAACDPIALWEALLDDIADQAAEDHVPTEDDLQWHRGLDAMVKSKLAELRRQHTPATATVREGIVIPDTILALDREALLARLENLRQAGAVRYSHQELIGLSDSDLRGMLALLVSPTER